jgi:hypothetical protein
LKAIYYKIDLSANKSLSRDISLRYKSETPIANHTAIGCDNFSSSRRASDSAELFPCIAKICCKRFKLLFVHNLLISVVGVNISKIGNYTILITASESVVAIAPQPGRHWQSKAMRVVIKILRNLLSMAS